jgi:hypothetical protein
MNIEDEILINKYGQDLISADELLKNFSVYDLLSKGVYLRELLGLIVQSKPKDEDIELAIKESGLKPTFTPCVLLQKGVANHHLQKIVELPEVELSKAFVLLLSLFKVAYSRRFKEEKNSPNKWWYWDLSNNETVDQIRNKY